MLENEDASRAAQIAAEARLEYQKFNDLIRDLKRQQWSLAYYALAIYGVIVVVHGILSETRDVGNLGTMILTTSPVIAFFLVLWLIGWNVQSLMRARKHLMSIRQKFFTTEIQQSLNEIDAPKTSYDKWWYDWQVLLPLILVAIIGCATVIWIVAPWDRADEFGYICSVNGILEKLGSESVS